MSRVVLMFVTLLLAACAPALDTAEPSQDNPPSLRLAPPSLYSRTPPHRATPSRATPTPAQAERRDDGSAPPPTTTPTRTERIDDLKRKINDARREIRDLRKKIIRREPEELLLLVPE